MTRTITGRILPYGEPGRTSAGTITFASGSLHIPNDLGKVKLLRDHSTHGGGPVGVLASWHVDESGVFATFTVPKTAAGDEALIEAQSVRNRFSVEVTPVERNGPYITKAVLKAVALVPYPAFEKAEVVTVTASDHTPLILAEDHVDTIIVAADPLASTTPAAPAAPAPAPVPAPAADPVATPPQVPVPPAPPATAAAAPRPATVPAGLGTPAAAPEPLEFSEVAERIMAIRSGAEPADVLAELTDVTNSDNLAATPPAWLGQVWSGVTYQRRIVPLLTPKPLTSWKAVGYKWKTKPAVGKYTGDKTEIPSTKPEIVPVEMTAERWAGGNDIDRKFLDFNDSAFLAEYWAAMAESYALETDEDAAAWLTTNATAFTGGTFADPVRAISAAAVAIDQAIHSPATFAIVNPTDLTQLLDISQLEAPHYGNIAPLGDPSKWTTSDFVASGTAIVGHKAAASFYELGGSPLRAQALHIARGGFDAALFGYTAKMLNRPEALLKVTWTPPAGA